MKNREVVELFSRVADMLAIRGDQIHRILAYRKAAESIDALGRDVNVIFAEGKLTEIPGIGDTLAAKIEEMLTTGRLVFYDKPVSYTHLDVYKRQSHHDRGDAQLDRLRQALDEDLHDWPLEADGVAEVAAQHVTGEDEELRRQRFV